MSPECKHTFYWDARRSLLFILTQHGSIFCVIRVYLYICAEYVISILNAHVCVHVDELAQDLSNFSSSAVELFLQFTPSHRYIDSWKIGPRPELIIIQLAIECCTLCTLYAPRHFLVGNRLFGHTESIPCLMTPWFLRRRAISKLILAEQNSLLFTYI